MPWITVARCRGGLLCRAERTGGDHQAELEHIPS
jgi:hypothetical protein